MDMKRHMTICFSYACWWIRKKNEMEVIIKKKNEVLRLENDIVIFEIVFEMVYGWPYEGFQKNPPYTSSNYSSLELIEFYFLKIPY
jgi:hypothetical protein